MSTEDQNIAAAAAIYNKDRLNWDIDDTTDVNINNTLGGVRLRMPSAWDIILILKRMAAAISCGIIHLIM